MNIIEHEVNSVAVGQRQSDGFINGTAMCVAHGKLIADWFRNQETIDLINVLAEDLGLEINYGISHNSSIAAISVAYPRLIVSKRGSPKTGGGTWLYPDLAVQLAQWCSAKFAIKVSRWVREWMTIGKNPVQSREIDRLKLELEVIKAKQRYLDTNRDLVTVTSPEFLAWLRGESLPPAKVVSETKFVEQGTNRLVGSSSGHSLTDLLRAAGLNPQSAKERKRAKEVLARHGLSYDTLQGWSTAAYLRQYPVLDDATYDRALKILMSEIVSGEMEPNLFVNQFVSQLAKGKSAD